MTSSSLVSPLVGALVFFLLLTSQVHATIETRQVYIVYLGSLSETTTTDHYGLLREIVDTRFMKKNLLRSYKRSFNGFAASLTAQEHEKLAGHEKVISIFPNAIFRTQTTRSWDFMGLPMNIPRNLPVESDIIIGVIDSGIWPESESFNDRGLNPPPLRWKGACNGGENFTCNNKLIGARYYIMKSARDDTGHGSHTASTAAGRPISASFYGIAGGVTRGGVPSARIAVYKACRQEHCEGLNILSAFDDAIRDGVDMISVSLAEEAAPDLPNDAIAIGAFHASKKNILVVQAAGNTGRKSSVSSVAPWIFSVAASSSDRAITTRVTLGDGTTYNGKSIDSFNLNGTSFPIVYGNESRCPKEAAKSCDPGCLEPTLVKGKIVLCNKFNVMKEVTGAGALGAIVYAGPWPDVSNVLPTAASSLNEKDFKTIESYISSSESPKAGIQTSESTTNVDAPRVASFSSRGPNVIIPDILKPDITAPGIEILAAYSPLVSPTQEDPSDHRSVAYNILSGTSMACPHVTGAAAYVKSFHLDWSSSAVKSALMTTASRMDASKDQLAEFSYGAGHVDPRKAIDPGLVYETSTEDYINLLCNSGYNTAKLRQLFTVNSSCNGVNTPKDMNYPSMTVRVSGTSFSENFTRKVTNVGVQNSRYEVKTSTSSDYRIVVNPTILTFRALGETQSFEVSISGKINGYLVSAYIEWTDGVHTVRSPVVVYSNNSINEPIFSWARSIGSNKIFYLFLAFLVNYI
ncbi:hypothetical protein ACP275_12G089200 [Erythranthe tilingii]